jgi:hypothetical protein
LNFRADPAVVQRILPHPFRPKLVRGHSIVGVCLIRLENMRPVGMPAILGVSSENAAHRFAIEWTDPSGLEHEGVYIPRRDTDSLLNRLIGGRLFPGEHHPARFSVADNGSHIEFSMESSDGSVSVGVVGDVAESLTGSSCFASLAEASVFFEGGSLGFSATRDGDRLEGLLLRTIEWRARPLAVREVRSSYFEDEGRFPKGSVQFDHALVMRDVIHEWHKATDLLLRQKAAEALGDPTLAPGTSPAWPESCHP